MPAKKTKTFTSKVEQIAISRTGQALRYPATEKVNVIIVENVPDLGKLTALRFLEWAQNNEGWSVALPTGKSPVQFIKWVIRLLGSWENRETQKFLDKNGVDPGHKPDMKSFHFIQIDEYYPISSEQHNSFYYYVSKFYIKGFNFDVKKALLINSNNIGIPPNETLYSIWPDRRITLNLRMGQVKNSQEIKQKKVLEAVDQFCTDYESKIRALGGIGFFLGGLGPDGHIGFNVRGTDHYSTTRLTSTNYETQAYSAADLGGMEISRHHLVITIGLQTIVNNPATTAIIIASGEAKAQVVRDAIQQPKDNQYPATVLHDLENSSFYLTRGSAKLLAERQFLEIQNSKIVTPVIEHQVLIDLAIKKNKRLTDLNRQDMSATRSSKELLELFKDSYREHLHDLEQELQKRSTAALIIPENQIFLHTAPQHDEIMLGYFPYLVRMIREPSNSHYFNYLTSGFSAITNNYMHRLYSKLKWFLNRSEFRQLGQNNYFDPDNISARNQDVLLYLDGLVANSDLMKDEAISRRLLRNLIEIFEDDSFTIMTNRVNELLSYFSTPYSGKKELHYIQQLKGMVPEWESDVKWGHFGFRSESVIHSRLGFNRRENFTEEPVNDRDLVPLLNNLKKIKPTVVTVALHPEGSAVSTAYKVLQIVAQALRIYCQETNRRDIEIWGYRTVWFRFHPAEANFYIPVNLNSFAISSFTYMNSLVSQTETSFPSYEYDGPLIELAQKIQVEQYQQLKTLLGKEYFLDNSSPLIRSTRGMIYLKRMTPDELWQTALDLKKIMENPQ
jgi:glucosamine-6-phosphate deaminase